MKSKIGCGKRFLYNGVGLKCGEKYTVGEGASFCPKCQEESNHGTEKLNVTPKIYKGCGKWFYFKKELGSNTLVGTYCNSVDLCQKCNSLAQGELGGKDGNWKYDMFLL